MTGEQRELIEGVIESLIQEDLDRGDAVNAPAVRALRTLLARHDRMRELLGRAVAERIDDEWLAAARSALGRTPPGGGG